LNPDTLARLVYAASRETMKNSGDGTTPEFYVTDIAVNPEPEPPKDRAEPRKRRKIEPKGKRTRKIKRVAVTRYRDSETGRYASEVTWKRSRASIRAHAARKGTAPGRGRYVRVVEWQVVE
jgi:hypothetical protein